MVSASAAVSAAYRAGSASPPTTASGAMVTAVSAASVESGPITS